MSDNAVLSVRGLGKKFCPELSRSLRYGIADIFGELVPRVRPVSGLRPGEFWAVDDVSFDLERGESIAIIGNNGAGKSTLLKMLYGLIKPDRGEVRINGRVEAIIELGTGFNSVLSGRENIETAATVYGLGKGSRSSLIDAVLDFAEIGDFADAPMQTYSSGMKARLGFALASHLEPDLLLVDEALAVGDINFQRKAVAKIRSYLEAGGSLVFVSHHYYQIQTICRRGLLIDRGRQIFLGSAVEALDAMYKRRTASASDPARRPAQPGPVRITDVAVHSLAGEQLRPGDAARITIRFEAHAATRLNWGFSILTQDQWVCLAGEQSSEPVVVSPGAGELSCVIPALPLSPGSYLLTGALVDPETTVPFDLYGYGSAPSSFEIAGSAADLTRRARGQVLQLDVDWNTAPEALRG